MCEASLLLACFSTHHRHPVHGPYRMALVLALAPVLALALALAWETSNSLRPQHLLCTHLFHPSLPTPPLPTPLRSSYFPIFILSACLDPGPLDESKPRADPGTVAYLVLAPFRCKRCCPAFESFNPTNSLPSPSEKPSSTNAHFTLHL